MSNVVEERMWRGYSTVRRRWAEAPWYSVCLTRSQEEPNCRWAFAMQFLQDVGPWGESKPIATFSRMLFRSRKVTCEDVNAKFITLCRFAPDAPDVVGWRSAWCFRLTGTLSWVQFLLRCFYFIVRFIASETLYPHFQHFFEQKHGNKCCLYSEFFESGKVRIWLPG